jgi:hypothetical protein
MDQPLGSSLRDFKRSDENKAWGLFPAEEKLLEAARAGKECCINCSLPTSPGDSNRIRAGLLRFLLLGGDESAPVHQRGVSLHGAYIDGDIDLRDSEVLRPLRLRACRIDGSLLGENAKFKCCELTGSHLKGINCDGAKFDGDLVLDQGFSSQSEVRFVGCQINGNLNCSGGNFYRGTASDNETRALFFSLSRIAQKVSLNEGFIAQGEVRGVDVEIGGHLDCRNAQFNNPGHAACHFDGAKISGAIFLACGFRAEGDVHFPRAKIGGDFNCIGGHFEHPAMIGLDLDGIQISHKLRLNDQTKIDGGINLAGAHARILSDTIEAWPDGNTRLDGFTYNRIDSNAPADAFTRKQWLKRQPPNCLGKDFRPQPFQQLIRVLREMGHEQEAADIAILKEKTRLRRDWSMCGKDRPWQLNPERWVRWLFLEKDIGFGYHPQRIITVAIAFWLLSALIYWAGSAGGVFAPANPVVYLNADLYSVCNDGWTRCEHLQMSGEHTTFMALIYSLDVLLPILPLGQEAAWSPMIKSWDLDLGVLSIFTICRFFVIIVMWIEIIFGWAVSLILAALVSGLIRRD